MGITVTPTHRALAAGGLAAAIAIGAFALGSSQRGAAPPSAAGTSPSRPAASGVRPALLSAAAGAARITVTGTGNVTGTPNQLILSMGVQVNGSSVGSALASASAAARGVTAALRAGGVGKASIQTSGLSISPNYPASSQAPSGYTASESLTATLNSLAAAGSQINAAVHAGGNATTVSGISLNLTDTSALLATARARAVADARVKAGQYARALGQPLGPVISITDQPPAQPFPVNGAYSASGAKAAVPISPGSQQLSVSVTVVFAV
jgi:uncharacterized protein YggE